MAKIVKVRAIAQGAGIQFCFDNGLVVSIGHGCGYRGTNYHNNNVPPCKTADIWEAKEVEIAVFHNHFPPFLTSFIEPLKKYSDGEVANFVPVEKIGETLEFVSKLTEDEVQNMLRIAILLEKNEEVRK